MIGLNPRIDKIFIRGILCKNSEVLLLKSKKNGKYVFPGATMNDYETVERTIKRGLKNDIGFEKAEIGNFINMWSFKETRNSIDYYYSVIDFELITTEDSSYSLNDKYSEAKWFKEGELGNIEMDSGQKITLDKYFARRRGK